MPSDTEGVPGLGRQHRHVRRARVDGQSASRYASHIEEVCDQRAHPVGLLEDDPMELAHLGGVHF